MSALLHNIEEGLCDARRLFQSIWMIGRYGSGASDGLDVQQCEALATVAEHGEDLLKDVIRKSEEHLARARERQQ